jgi:hypothetical protein
VAIGVCSVCVGRGVGDNDKCMASSDAERMGQCNLLVNVAVAGGLGRVWCKASANVGGI